MTMVMMTSMALTRETERGTMENLLAMPATSLEIMLGKVLPYLAVGAVQVTVVLIAAKLLFNVPFAGSMPLLLTGILVFVSALVLLGYTISTVAKTQMQAMQLTFFYFFCRRFCCLDLCSIPRHAGLGAIYWRNVSPHPFLTGGTRCDAQRRRLSDCANAHVNFDSFSHWDLQRLPC